MRRYCPRRTARVLRRLLVLPALAAGALALCSPVAPGAAGQGGPPAAPPVVAEAAAAAADATAEPLRVRIPAIGLDAPLVRLGLDAAGALEPPADSASAGWYTGGPVPGATGPAVLAGHVDSRTGPAVFARLGDLAPGDDVLVDRADGTTVRFTVERVGRHPKDRFPTEAVYGPTPRPELRLVTCGGEFDRDRRSYTDNVVVTAVPAG